MPSMIVSVEGLEAGQILDEDILNAHGVALLSRNTVLDTKTIELIKNRDFVRQVRIRVPGDEIPVLHEFEGAFVHSANALNARARIGQFLDMARWLESLAPGHIDSLMKDVQPVISDIFDGPPPIFDRIRELSEHDDYTHQHSWMVMIMALAMLRACWDRGILSPDWQARTDLGLGAALHDLGKARIPLEILNKPGKLNLREWETIRAHPEVGYKMVCDTENVPPLARAIVAHHHQHLDGSGYGPENIVLSGENIPNLVRITTVADVYDALVSERPYRLGYLPFHALKFLEAHAGSRFDDRFVHVLSRIVIDFPLGSILLFPQGIIASVKQADLKEKQNPLISIVGTLSRHSASLVGKTYRLQEPETGTPGMKDLVMGAASLECLSLKIQREMEQQGLEQFLGSADERTLVSLSDWEGPFEEHLRFIHDQTTIY